MHWHHTGGHTAEELGRYVPLIFLLFLLHSISWVELLDAGGSREGNDERREVSHCIERGRESGREINGGREGGTLLTGLKLSRTSSEWDGAGGEGGGARGR